MTISNVGERIAELREAQVKKQRELAEEAGISPSTLSQIESGRVPNPHISTIRKIARALAVEPQELTSPKGSSRPSPGAPNSGDEGRRSLYLTTVLEEARDMARHGLWMRDREDYGESPQELTGWAWKISDFQSRVWVMQERWETRVFGPLSEQSIPSWERYLLNQIREDLEKAENAAYQTDRRFRQYLDNQDARIKKAVEQLLESTRVPARDESSSNAQEQ
jgi:transcriptional regulator with XRE-family HTH domain